MDTQKVIIALTERLGLTIDHESKLVDAKPGRHPWGGDSFTPDNFAQLRKDVDDLQEIAMGLADALGFAVTVEDGRKVSVTKVEKGNGKKGRATGSDND